MKRNYLFLGIGVLLFLLVYYWATSHRHFVWEPTFSHSDDEPLGCQIFDSLAAMTSSHGYTYLDTPLEDIVNRPGKSSLLLVNTDVFIDDSLCSLLGSYVKRGNDVMIISSGVYGSGSQDNEHHDVFVSRLRSIRFNSIRYPSFVEEELSESMANNLNFTLYDDRSPADSFVVNQYFVTSFLTTAQKQVWKSIASGSHLHSGVNADESVEDLPEYGNVLSADGRESVAMVMSYGKGKVYYVSLPFLFTNYGALDPQMVHFQQRILSYIDDRPIIRINTIYGEEDEVSTPHKAETALRYLIEHRPLRWALYSALVTLLLFMLFKARRRQRVIPYVEPQQNPTLELVRLVGGIYRHRNDLDNVFRKKYNFFTDEMLRSRLVDLADSGHLDKKSAYLASVTGLDKAQVAAILEHLNRYAKGDFIPDRKELYLCINEMNLLLKLCRNNRDYTNKNTTKT